MSKFDENRVIGANKERKYETFASQYTRVLEHLMKRMKNALAYVMNSENE